MVIDGSLEFNLPTIKTDEQHRRKSEEKVTQEKIRGSQRSQRTEDAGGRIISGDRCRPAQRYRRMDTLIATYIDSQIHS